MTVRSFFLVFFLFKKEYLKNINNSGGTKSYSLTKSEVVTGKSQPEAMIN